MKVQEDIVGLYAISVISTSTIVHIIKDVLVRLNLILSECRGQYCDGASNMRGPRSGVAKQLRNKETLALYIHCHGHPLNLAAGDAIKKCKHTKMHLVLLLKCQSW